MMGTITYVHLFIITNVIVYIIAFAIIGVIILELYNSGIVYSGIL